jgi:hypothetical protein
MNWTWLKVNEEFGKIADDLLDCPIKIIQNSKQHLPQIKVLIDRYT